VAAQRAGLPRTVGLHTLRPSAATVLLEDGVHLKVVSEIFGHFSVSVTGDIYSHVIPEFSAGDGRLGRGARAVMVVTPALGPRKRPSPDVGNGP
jgi:hypothetical protein